MDEIGGEYLGIDANRLSRVASRLKSENERLRELIADTLLDPREYCEKYGIEYEGWDSANAHIDKRMIELGVDARR